MKIRYRIYVVTRRTVMAGEQVSAVYRDGDMAALHLATIDLWQNAIGGIHIIEGPWWWMFRGRRYLTARARQKCGHLDWPEG